MPTFTGTDVYQLDGMPVVACAAGVTSPSCSTGVLTHRERVLSPHQL
jgi:hypothetical protein